MYVSRRLSVTPLYCVVDARARPEKCQFLLLPEGFPFVSRESIMKLRELLLR